MKCWRRCLAQFSASKFWRWVQTVCRRSEQLQSFDYIWLNADACHTFQICSELLNLLINKIQLKWSRRWPQAEKQCWLPAVTDLTCGHLLLLPIGRHPAALTFELSWGFSPVSEHRFTSRSDLQDKSLDYMFFHRHCKQFLPNEHFDINFLKKTFFWL